MTLKKNGYSSRQRAWKPKSNEAQNTPFQLQKRAFLPYIKEISGGIARILGKFGIKSIFKPPAKVRQFLRTPKDTIPLQNPGVYLVPCSCGSSYIGETKRAIKTRLNEHVKAIQNNAVTKSAICEHIAYNDEHFIRFDKAKSIAAEKFYVPRIVREAIEIKKHKNFNRDSSFKLSTTWDPLISKLKPIRTNIQVADVVSVVCTQNYTSSIEEEPNPSSPTAIENAPTTTHRYNLRARSRTNNNN
ncbi:uncharacterized protein LOC129919304 [Episyrphus balteatus]|uniref:uncharacterized protein LOC129919304 n=1 Tax=Episyrphus balteatus TaxID=286459 RepID=UPI002486A128|nr:uncharacterized protein LOC129919304 [Episyrphus balteatus]